MPEDIRQISIPAGTSNFVTVNPPTNAYILLNVNVPPSKIEFITPEGIVMEFNVSPSTFGFAFLTGGFPVPVKYGWTVKIYGHATSNINGFVIFYW